MSDTPFDADATDRRLAADVAWGSPYGATVHDFDQLQPSTNNSSSKAPADRPPAIRSTASYLSATT